MAKRKGPNVSAAIREYLGKHPKAKPSEAAAELSKALGKKIPATYVSNIKSMKKKKGGKKARGADRGNGKPTGDIFDGIKAVRQALAILGREKVLETVDMFAG